MGSTERRSKLVESRLAHGWTQQHVASCLGITASFYGMIEQGVRTPKLALALAIARLFDTDIAELFAAPQSAVS